MNEFSIFDFSTTLPDWQNDALRRIANSENENEVKYDEIFQNAKAEYGIGAAIGLKLFEAQGDEVDAAIVGNVTLKAVGPISGIDRLAEDQVLPFAESGITAVFGNNGVGKSGYGRVLKHVCRTLSKAKGELRGNIFESGNKTQTVRLTFSVGGEMEKTVDWIAGSAPPSELRLITVCDSSAARLYANEQNEIDFLPREIELLSRLRKVIERVGLDAERSATQLRVQISKPLPTLHEGTSISSLVAGFSELTKQNDEPTIEAINMSAEWSDADQSRLERLNSELFADSQFRANVLGIAATNLRTLAVSVYLAERRFRDSSLDLIDELRSRLVAAEAAERLAREVSFSDEPIRGTGTEPWALLFEAARTFATGEFGEKPYEDIETGELCVLCQQPLSEEAARRMMRFDEFVRAEASVQANSAREALANHVYVYQELKLERLAESIESIEVLSLSGLDVLVSEAVEFSRNVIKPCEAGGASFDPRDFQELVPIRLGSRLAAFAKSLKRQSRALAEGAPADTLKDLRSEIAELEDQKTLAENLPLFLERREAFLQLSALKSLGEFCSKRRIATLITELRRALLTDELAERIFTEMTKLDIKELPVTFNDRTRVDQSFGGVALDGAIKSAKSSDILSEGEQRALALSVFLAEIGLVSENHGIIVDDPVSSLDDVRMRKVAKRLAEEGRLRQVIVFTHSMTFFAELREAALELQVPVETNYMFKGVGGAYGSVEANSEPWELKTLKARIARLRGMAAEISQDLDPEQYKACIRQISAYLRESWERLVEEKLLYGVVQRFARPVATQKLRGVIVSDEDFAKVFFAMKKVSEWTGHDAPAGAPLQPPSPDEVVSEIDDLAEYAKSLDKARVALEAQRRALVPS